MGCSPFSFAPDQVNKQTRDGIAAVLDDGGFRAKLVRSAKATELSCRLSSSSPHAYECEGPRPCSPAFESWGAWVQLQSGRETRVGCTCGDREAPSDSDCTPSWTCRALGTEKRSVCLRQSSDGADDTLEHLMREGYAICRPPLPWLLASFDPGGAGVFADELSAALTHQPSGALFGNDIEGRVVVWPFTERAHDQVSNAQQGWNALAAQMRNDTVAKLSASFDWLRRLSELLRRHRPPREPWTFTRAEVRDGDFSRNFQVVHIDFSFWTILIAVRGSTTRLFQKSGPPWRPLPEHKQPNVGDVVIIAGQGGGGDRRHASSTDNTSSEPSGSRLVFRYADYPDSARNRPVRDYNDETSE